MGANMKNYVIQGVKLSDETYLNLFTEEQRDSHYDSFYKPKEKDSVVVIDAGEGEDSVFIGKIIAQTEDGRETDMYFDSIYEIPELKNTSKLDLVMEIENLVDKKFIKNIHEIQSYVFTRWS